MVTIGKAHTMEELTSPVNSGYGCIGDYVELVGPLKPRINDDPLSDGEH